MSGTVQVVTKHSPLAFILYATKITLTVDGQSSKVPWGEQTVTLEPGRHQIDISFRYIGSDRGKASVAVDVTDGSQSRVTYKAPWLVTMAGKIHVEP